MRAAFYALSAVALSLLGVAEGQNQTVTVMQYFTADAR